MKPIKLNKRRHHPRPPTWAEALGFCVAILLLWSLLILYVCGVLGW